MSPHLFLLGLIGIGVAIQALCEWIYLRHAPFIHVRVRNREMGLTQRHIMAEAFDMDGFDDWDFWATGGVRKQTVLHFVRARLDPAESDGRVVQLRIDRTFYEAVKEGDRFKIQALPHRPRWLFWSDMVRKPRWWMDWRPIAVIPGAFLIGCLLIYISLSPSIG